MVKKRELDRCSRGQQIPTGAYGNWCFIIFLYGFILVLMKTLHLNYLYNFVFLTVWFWSARNMLQSILELVVKDCSPFLRFFVFTVVPHLPCKPVALCSWELCTQNLELHLVIFCIVLEWWHKSVDCSDFCNMQKESEGWHLDFYNFCFYKR